MRFGFGTLIHLFRPLVILLTIPGSGAMAQRSARSDLASALRAATNDVRAARLDEADTRITKALAAAPVDTVDPVVRGLQARLLSLRASVRLGAKGEADASWAVALDETELEHWLAYARHRLRNEGYRGVLTSLQAREQVTYDGEAIDRRRWRTTIPTLDGPDYSDPWAILTAATYDLVEKREAATAVLEASLRVRPGCLTALFLMRLYVEALNYEAAESALASLSSTTCPLQWRQAEPHYLVGLLDQRKGSLSSARSRFREALLLDPEYLPAQVQLVLAGSTMSGPRETGLRQIIEHSPDHWPAWVALWECCARSDSATLGRFTELATRRAWQSLAAPLRAQALSSIAAGSFVLARDRLLRARDLSSNDASLILDLAVASRLAGPVDARLLTLLAETRPEGYDALLPFVVSQEIVANPEAVLASLFRLELDNHATPTTAAAVRAYRDRLLSSDSGRSVVIRSFTDLMVRELQSHRIEIDRVSADGRLFLTRLLGVEARTIGVEQQGRLTSDQIAQLRAHYQRLSHDLIAFEGLLIARLDQGDRDIQEKVAAIEQQLSTVDVKFSDLEAKLRTKRLRLTDVVSLGFTFGPVSINVLPLIEALLARLAA